MTNASGPPESCVEIDGATIRYPSTGDGPAIVFVHGVYVGGSLWHEVVARLDGFRCIVPTWPLGAHADPAPTRISRHALRRAGFSVCWLRST